MWLLFAVIFAAVQIGSIFNPPLMDDVDSSHAQAAQYFSEHSDWVSAHINGRHNEAQGVKEGFFGFYECLPDAEASRALLQAAEDWVKARGMKKIIAVVATWTLLASAFATTQQPVVVLLRSYYRYLVTQQVAFTLEHVLETMPAVQALRVGPGRFRGLR